MSEESRLAAVVDGVTLGGDATQALWKEFSAHMDANKGDMAGFAKLKGWHAVAPEYRQGKAVLLVQTTAGAPMPAPVKAPAKARPAGKPKAKAKLAGKGRPGPAGKAKAGPAKKGAPAKKTAGAQKAGGKPKR